MTTSLNGIAIFDRIIGLDARDKTPGAAGSILYDLPVFQTGS
jgi:hypothetical protein